MCLRRLVTVLWQVGRHNIRNQIISLPKFSKYKFSQFSYTQNNCSGDFLQFGLAGTSNADVSKELVIGITIRGDQTHL